MAQAVRTEIKFNKTSCYFCNEWLETDSFKEHIQYCSQVLEKCPNHCQSYVQRKSMKTHMDECPKRISTAQNYHVNGEDNEKRFLTLEQELATLRSILNEEIRQRLQLITDVGILKKKNQISDEWTNKVSEVLNALKKCLNEETTTREMDLNRCRDQITTALTNLNELENWRVQMYMRLDEIQTSITECENLRESLDILMNDNGVHIAKINRLEAELNELKFEISENLDAQDKELNVFSDRLKTFDSVLLGQNNSLQTINVDLTNKLETLFAQLQTQITVHTELTTKQEKLDYEVKSVKNIIHETEDKSEKLEKLVTEYKLKTAETRQKLDDLETHLKYQNQITEIHNTRGHLIWKIDKYTEKLKEAKENDVYLRSPLFCNRQYGYTLRLDVHLNGIGNWKGRNIIACLTVVNGDYDPLLSWPCKLEADIILRDQPDDLNDSKNVYKTIVVKKKNDDKKIDINQYIHIPHKTLESCSFIKNNSIFLEVRVHPLSRIK